MLATAIVFGVAPLLFGLVYVSATTKSRLDPLHFVLAGAIGPAIIGLAVATILWGRARGWLWTQPPLVAALDRGTRRRLLRAMRRGEPVAPEYQPMASHLVLQTRRMRWLPLGFLLHPLATLSRLDDRGDRPFRLTMAAFLLVIAGKLAYQQARIVRWRPSGQ